MDKLNVRELIFIYTNIHFKQMHSFSINNIKISQIYIFGIRID